MNTWYIIIIGFPLFEACRALWSKQWFQSFWWVTAASITPLSWVIAWIVGNQDSNLIWLGFVPFGITSVWLLVRAAQLLIRNMRAVAVLKKIGR